MDTIIIFKEIDMNIGFKDSIKPIDAEQGFYLKDYLRDAYESVSGYTLIGYASATGHKLSYTDTGVDIPEAVYTGYFDLVESFDDMHIDDISDMCKDAGIKHIDYTDADDAYEYLFERLTDAYYTKGKQSEKRFKDIQRLENGIDDTHKDMPYTKSPF